MYPRSSDVNLPAIQSEIKIYFFQMLIFKVLHLILRFVQSNVHRCLHETPIKMARPYLLDLPVQ